MQPYRPQTPREQFSRPATPGSPSHEKESHMGNDFAARQAIEASDVRLREYAEHKQRLAAGIEKASYMLGDLRNFVKEEWQIQYPHVNPVEASDSNGPRRTLTFADEHAATESASPSTSVARKALKRSMTGASAPASASASPSSASSSSSSSTLVDRSASSSSCSDHMSILRLDLNMGAARSLKNIAKSLERQSISNLVDEKLGESLAHLAQLRDRVHDPHSRVLVTGDLNAGKSTLINALLRRPDVMPTDQQPFTTRFVEVVSAKENDGVEEIHVLDQMKKYDITDKTSFTVENIDLLELLATDPDSDATAPPMRVFLKEAPQSLSNPSILHNGVVDISLIDAPGLNRDSVKTTANFARQPEIDVIVFVVSAANHFTLSATEFIWQAGHEKAHLFIVVNRFDQIRDKERCRRAVLEQIKQYSPETYADAADLVHFVDSAKVALGCAGMDDADDTGSDELDVAFSHLEHSLRSFVLVNRAKSKLGPAQNYITHLCADVEVLAATNTATARHDADGARAELDKVKPVLEKMKKGKEGLEEALVAEEESAAGLSATRTRTAMIHALERVGRGQLADKGSFLAMPTYPGLLGVWDYTKEVKRALLASLDFAATLAEDDARSITTDGVVRVNELGEKYLPEENKSKRVFNKAAMFSARPPRLSRRTSSSMATLGLGLARQGGMTEVHVSDIIDITHHLFLARAHLPVPSPSPSHSASSTALTTLGAEVSGLGFLSLAAGALTVGGKAYGLRNVLDSLLRLSDLAAHPLTRKYFAPALALALAAAAGYMVYDLPQSIPRNVGRHIQATLLVTSGTVPSGGQEADAAADGPWADAQAQRVSQEVRKVMRLAAWDVRERFRAAVDAKGAVVRECEETRRRAERALEYFQGLGIRIEEIRKEIGVKI